MVKIRFARLDKFLILDDKPPTAIAASRSFDSLTSSFSILVFRFPKTVFPPLISFHCFVLLRRDAPRTFRTKMAWRDATVGQSIVMVANGAIRAAQIVTGVLTIFLYAGEKWYWQDHGLPDAFVSVCPNNQTTNNLDLNLNLNLKLQILFFAI
jgi:hypothetical protein